MRRVYIPLFSFFYSLITILSISCAQAQLEGTRPNIVVILMDDMGYSDIGSYGGEIRTPNIDKLAKGGVKLSNMCNDAICVQTRRSLMSGKPYFTSIDKDSSLPAVLKKVKYHTLMVGKAHFENDLEPIGLGFDQFFGFRGGSGSYTKPSTSLDVGYYENLTPFVNKDPNFYSTDAFTDKAIEFIKPANLGDSNPFFLYLAYQAAHKPLSVPEEDIAKYRGIYLRGWKALSDERYQNLLKTGIFPANADKASYPTNFPNWDALTPAQRDLEDLRMATYAAMVARADSGIGRLIDALKANGQLDNTLILFMSDNGADAVPHNEDNQIDVLNGDMPSNTGTSWAYTRMTPFRYYKGDVYSGGVKTGAIAYWPDKIKPRTFTSNPNGATNKSLLHITDVFPTFLDLAFPVVRAAERDRFKANSDGISFTSTLTSENEIINRPPIFLLRLTNDRSVRTNDWTMLKRIKTGGNSQNWELYRNADFSESNDLATQFPSVVNKLSTDWEKWFQKLQNVGTLPNGGKPDPVDDPYIPLAFPAGTITNKFGYMEAVGSDHLSAADALLFPERPNKPLATVFRGDGLQYTANGNAGIDGYPIPLELNTAVPHRLVLKERIPARLRLDLFSSADGQDFIYEYPNVPSDIKVYTGNPIRDNEGNNFTAITKVNSLALLMSSNSTVWFWENGTAYLKYKTPIAYRFTSQKGGADNVFFCLYNNCIAGANKAVVISDFEGMDTRGKLVPKPGLNISAITNVAGKDNYTITKVGADDACVEYRLELNLQNWEGVSTLSIDATGLKNSEVLIEDKSIPNAISIGTITSDNGVSLVTLPGNKNQLDQIKTIVIRTCENDFTGATKTIKLNEIMLGDGSNLITSIENKSEESSEAVGVAIYPNPSNDGVFNLSQSINWKVTSILGKELKAGNSNQINLSGYSKGVYLVKVGGKVERVVVN